MNDSHTVCLMVCVLVITFVTGGVYNSTSKTEAITKMIERGYSPVEAGCALNQLDFRLCTEIVKGLYQQ